ncbi:gephyrin-like molybdotransferase Glp [Leptolyngbya sp. 7M]|uniref:molybdopterin molybdotransferase MoeA n=1 Tax=Leptolyngbya sp. 7M TaxID=2812896 RepID=UPI001B8C301B|nr:gephyrin-like molybdotransferase Glp [Leptolyngbya sp. 7M]QYO66163.1 molybdopterin molybdotransferase MoeA [Leptolyngbya sp. 7M]
MIPVKKALSIIEKRTKPLGMESVPLNESVGRVLAEDIVADQDLPPFDRSQMDGYAVKAADTANVPVTLKLVGESAAGRGWTGRLRKGEAVRIMTGAPVPAGADAVQKLEVANESDGYLLLSEPTEKGRFIVKRAAEVKKGSIVLSKGERITSNSLAIPAAFGYSTVKVTKMPRIAIFSTGSEIVEIHKKPKADQIRNSNCVMLGSLTREVGGDVNIWPIVGDNISDLRSQITLAATSADVLIMTGGVSVGKYDLTKAALRELGAEFYFDRVRLKPGKPTVFARLGKTIVFGLPGNPVSAAVTFHLFVRKCVLLMQSANVCDLSSGYAVLDDPVKGTKERDSYLPAIIATNPSGHLIASPIRWHGSSDLVGFSRADALIFVPKDVSCAAGDRVEVRFL